MGWRQASAWVAALPLVLALAVGSAGCTEDDSGLRGGCDIREPSCQQDLFERTAELREQDAASPPEVRTLDLDGVREELEQLLSEDPDPADPAWETALCLLGLLSGAQPLDDALVETTLENVAAYYDEDTQRITVVDRGEPVDPMQDSFLLSHELVHALQDERGQLVDFTDTWVDSTDSEVATSALIEGEATVIAAAVLESIQPPGRILDWYRFTEGLFASVLDSVEQADEPFLASVMLLPYGLGTRDLAPRWLVDGQPALDAEYASPRTSTLEWSGADGPDAEPEPLDCYPTTPPEGYAILDHDRFGLAALLAEAVAWGDSASTAWTLARAWRDDRAVVFGVPDDATAVAVAWRIRLADAQRADDLASSLRGLGLGLHAEVEDREVLVYAASDAAVADAWSDVGACGSFDALPDRDAPGSNMTASVRR